MDTLNFFTTLRPGWFNAWIPAWGMVLIQFVFMALHREGGRRAVDTSWYTPTDRRNAAISSGLQIALLILSIFVPLKSGVWLTVGTIVFALSLIAFIAAFLAYGLTPQGQTVTGGIYRLSRNPMYFAFFVGMIGACIASTPTSSSSAKSAIAKPPTATNTAATRPAPRAISSSHNHHPLRGAILHHQ